MNEIEPIEDLSMKNRLDDLHGSVEKIRKAVDTALKIDPEKLPSLKEKIDLDLFLVYAVNSMFWIHSKLHGVNPVDLGVKVQLNRIREYMVKVEQAQKRQTIRPKLDKSAAARFVKHGLNFRDKRKIDLDVTQNKKIRFDDDN
ncbi:unnamed protein product [Ceutorhynchus assimilis]|uniref:Nuclear nucleic acid-binding protein C1D n=1 Tax=Ceutorhynchus assimilis TaxID=467358 RepID=A0A9P0DCR3_9CUCU|nr:unnamed protein product [Ceutorhynchus assimilis]